MLFSLIICTWNRQASLSEVLCTLEACHPPVGTQWEILLVDNNSSDDTRLVCETFARKYPSLVRYVFEPRQGKSNALNTAIREARGEILAFTDDDVKIHPDWLTELLDAFQRFDCMGVAGRIVAVWESPKPKWFAEDGPYALMAAIVRYECGDEPCEVKVPPFGANFAFRRKAFEQFGEFRTDLGPNSKTLMKGEDTEFCARLLSAGQKIVYAPKAIIYHPVESKRMKKGYFEDWYFDYGRALVLRNGVPFHVRRILGIPRYQFPLLLQNLCSWVFAYDPIRRFHYKLVVLQLLGEMAEARRVRASSEIATGTVSGTNPR